MKISIAHLYDLETFQGNRHANVLAPELLVTSLKQVNEQVVLIDLTNSIYWNAHTSHSTSQGYYTHLGPETKGN
ncbi:hypothetical protein ACFX2I_040328 [Malus domestica]